MIDLIEMQDFRGIARGRLEALAPLTVLTGPNSSGKSAVLDALLIAAGQDPAEALGQAVKRHPVFFGNAAPYLIRRGAKHAEVRVDGDGDRRVCTVKSHDLPDRGIRMAAAFGEAGSPNRGEAVTDFDASNDYSVRNAPSPPLNWSLRLIDPGIPVPLHETYSRVVREGRKKEAVALLAELTHGWITDMEILTEDGTVGLYIIESGRGMPVELSGDGVQAFVQLVLELGSMPGGLALIEEPEVYQHPRAISLTARALVGAVGRGLQVVTTTHSLELIDALVAEMEEAGREDMAVFNLALEDGELRSARFGWEEILTARTTIEQDLR